MGAKHQTPVRVDVDSVARDRDLDILGTGQVDGLVDQNRLGHLEPRTLPLDRALARVLRQDSLYPNASGLDVSYVKNVPERRVFSGQLLIAAAEHLQRALVGESL